MGKSFLNPKHYLGVNFNCCRKVISLSRYVSQIKKSHWRSYYWPFLKVRNCLVLLDDGERDPGCIFQHLFGESVGLCAWSGPLTVTPVSAPALEQAQLQ